MARVAPGSMAVTIWGIGTVLHLIGTLAVVSAWIGHRPFEVVHINPAWFIPAVGNIFVPVAGVGFGFTEICWFFFSVGLLCWIVLLPAKLMPPLVILIAPPAVGFIAYLQFTGTLDPFTRILYYAATPFFLIIAMQITKLGRLAYTLVLVGVFLPHRGFHDRNALLCRSRTFRLLSRAGRRSLLPAGLRDSSVDRKDRSGCAGRPDLRARGLVGEAPCGLVAGRDV
ncbi:MAG: hypothetical protein QNJ43_07765 [Breoghania sp.]|nr:hypothetical protein [Breoghania sp.]MDJ0930746.1 hypothetical protein [Breoghania sp.]